MDREEFISGWQCSAASRNSPEDVYKILASLGIGFLYNPANQQWPGTALRAAASLVKLEITNPRYS